MAYDEMKTTLCYDIYEQILPLLPVKSLLRFKTVCKTWRDLISSATFIKSYSNGVVSQIHLAEYPYRAGAAAAEEEPGKVPWSVTIPSLNSQPSDIHAVEFPNPVVNAQAPLQYIFGSCNGLLLVAIANQSFLWNPSTRQHVKFTQNNIWDIDNHMNIYDYDTHLLVGLGFDAALDEYKVVLHICSDDIAMGGELYIRSSRAAKWKKVADHGYIYQLRKNKRGVTVNGCPHWIICNQNDPFTYNHRIFDRVVLIYLDIVEEKFKSLSTPIEWFCDYPEYEPYLGTLGGRLCATQRSYAKGTSDVWVMNEFGVRDSWTKLFVICHSVIKETFRPLGFINGGGDDKVVLVLNMGNIVTYNLKTKEQEIITRTAKDYHYCYWPNEFQLVEYTESLVSPRTFVQRPSRKRKRCRVAT